MALKAESGMRSKGSFNLTKRHKKKSLPNLISSFFYAEREGVGLNSQILQNIGKMSCILFVVHHCVHYRCLS